MQLKSSSRSGIKDNTGLTGGRASAVIRPATGDAGLRLKAQAAVELKINLNVDQTNHPDTPAALAVRY